MQLTPVKSSNIAAVGHDPVRNTLRIEFKSGATHDYADVSPEKHAALMAADSIGKHFHANIRNQHSSAKVED